MCVVFLILYRKHLLHFKIDNNYINQQKYKIMKKILFIISILIILASGCSTSSYYVYQTDSNIKLQHTRYNFEPYTNIPQGKHIVIKDGSSIIKKAQYASYKGYIYGTSNLSNPIQISSRDIKLLSFNTTDSTYSFKGKKIGLKESVNKKSSYTGTGEVHVKGYYRKDGTYVRPHTRKAPTRRR